MPRIVGLGSRTLRLSVVAVVILFAFAPLSRALLASVDGSFAPSPYTSLALRNPSNVVVGYQIGDLVPLRLTNHSGSTRTYHWNATQRGVVVSLGEKTLPNGRGADINVPTNFAKAGKLQITLSGTDVFITVSLVKPGT